jgi:hypothetical protein
MLLALLFAVAAPAAYAELGRMGPVDAFHFGFPAWYQDKTGVTFDLCSPGNQAELDGSWCVILAADVPGGLAPETFPTAFADEHFYWLASTGTNPTGLLVLAVEAGFGGGGPLPGDQIVFGRLRIRINNVPVTGNYKVYTPYGVFNFPGMTALDRLFFTSDIGIACTPGDFTCALDSFIGPFVLPSPTPGGPEIAPTTFAGTGRKYVADPGRVGPVTGSTLPPFVSAVDGLTYNHNRLRIEVTPTNGAGGPPSGPAQLVTDEINFSMFGRFMEDIIPGLVSVKRSSYSHTPTTPHKLDVFATAFPTTPGRLPPALPPAPIDPNLSFYDAPCETDPVTGTITGPPVGVLGLQMFNHGTDWWGANAPVVLPPQVCVRDAVTNALFLSDVTDEVDITVRSWDPTLNGGTLTVAATSSDQVALPTLNVSGFGPLTPGVPTSFPNVAAPPAVVTVVSLRGGVAALDVRTGVGVPGGAAPIANADSMTIDEDCSATPALTCATPPPPFDVLANDTVNGSPVDPLTATVALAGLPQLGTATLNPDNTISFTPNANASGTGVVGYTVTANGLTSNVALLTVTINPVNDNPEARNDSAGTTTNVPVTINALANDFDRDGPGQLANAVIVSLPGAGATLTCNGGAAAAVDTVCAGGVLSFTSDTAGPFTFTYNAQDSSGALSALPGTVTVTVSGIEGIIVTKNRYVVAQNRWVVTGLDNVTNGQTLTLAYTGGTYNTVPGSGLCENSAAGFAIGTTIVDPTGNWQFNPTLAPTGRVNPTNTGNTGFWCVPPTQLNISSPLGGTVNSTITLK